MRYCLYQKKTGRCTYIESKQALHDWINCHNYALSGFIMSQIDLHRVIVERGLLGYRFYSLGPRICSLGEYIVKHKLL